MSETADSVRRNVGSDRLFYGIQSCMPTLAVTLLPTTFRGEQET